MRLEVISFQMKRSVNSYLNSGSRRSLACAGANTLKNQSWRVLETRRDRHNSFIPGAGNVVFRRLTTTLSRCRWKSRRLKTCGYQNKSLPNTQRALDSAAINTVYDFFKAGACAGFGVGAVVSGKSSVRNGTAGKPALFPKFSVGFAKFTQP